MIAELNQNSSTSDTQIESKELCNVIAKAEKTAKGYIQVPESLCKINTDLQTAISDLRMNRIMTLDPSIMNNPSVSTSSHVTL